MIIQAIDSLISHFNLLITIHHIRLVSPQTCFEILSQHRISSTTNKDFWWSFCMPKSYVKPSFCMFTLGFRAPLTKIIWECSWTYIFKVHIGAGQAIKLGDMKMGKLNPAGTKKCVYRFCRSSVFKEGKKHAISAGSVWSVCLFLEASENGWCSYRSSVDYCYSFCNRGLETGKVFDLLEKHRKSEKCRHSILYYTSLKDAHIFRLLHGTVDI